jgi:dipeptidyl aminopeptidase/acylaminoacyl peptidase
MGRSSVDDRRGISVMPATTPYLDWQPLLDPVQVYSQPPSPQYPCLHGNRLYYLEQRAAEAGRSVLVRSEEDGSLTDITPRDYNLRSRVHEYGGKPHLLHDGHVYFSNDTDGRIYSQRLDPDAVPRSLLEADAEAGMSIDFQVTPDSRFLVFVHERTREGRENENRLCYVDLDKPGGINHLVSGADFYASPVISPDGSRIAWIEWQHPDMPWDAAELKMASLSRQGGQLRVIDDSITVVAGGDECSVCQPQFAADGRLIFALDGIDPVRKLASESWDLYARDGQTITRLTTDEGEYGEAFWVFGQQRYCVHADGSIEAVCTRKGIDKLVRIEADPGTATSITGGCHTSISQLSCAAGGSLFNAASFSRDAAIETSAAAGEAGYTLPGRERVLDEQDISVPRQLDYPTRDGGRSHALYYPPCNSAYQAGEDDLPPMLVMVHGGPTHRCEASLNYQRQYWTGRGFAILDINHRGSTGYGRRYRQALLGQWGILETADVADAVGYAIQQGLAHREQVCIRGSSAGGYEVLRALTLYPDLFCAGACYYGIGNLVTLMEITHKFEAHYLDGLLGEPFRGSASDQPGSPYYDRSPIRHLDALHSPMIIFQGLEDKVVPPPVSREIVAALEEKGITHQYVEYEGEGHGFRSKETRIDALSREAAFFLNVIRGTI